MIRWNNDYNHGAHPKILEALAAANDTSFGGYGTDECCARAADAIKKYLRNDQAEIHFLLGGTQTNYTVIAAALRSYQAVISAASGHICVHETGAIENTGHKIHALPGVDGKLTAEQIRKEAAYYAECGIQEHVTQPKLVFLSFPTEYGTLYSKEELLEIRAVCDRYNLYLYIDGARMGYGLGAADCDVTLEDLARIADAFYIGGTKCGALFGEAVVLLHQELKEGFRSHMKQNGALLAKGWLLGLQFETLFRDGLYFDITKQADAYAMKIKEAFAAKGIPAYLESSTNQQFVVVTQAQMDRLGEKHIYEYDARIDEDHHCIRFCTSWSTCPEDVKNLVEDILAL